jgi:hypothetical protein
MGGDHQGRTPDIENNTRPTQALPSKVSTLNQSGTVVLASAGEIRQWRNSKLRHF